MPKRHGPFSITQHQRVCEENTMDYKDSINLPKTDFPMKAALANREPSMLCAWQKSNLYQAIQKATKDRPSFILHDGPPYANGDIHIGHAVNKVLKDMVVRSRLLSGFRVPFVPGWDCHGLPIELQVEKKVGKVGDKVDAKTFRDHCRKYADVQIENQCKDFVRLGGLADWENRYASRDFSYEANMLRALGQIVDQGHLKRGVKPVHWCFDCGSALAEAEIEYDDKKSVAIDVLFPAVDQEALGKAFGAEGLSEHAGVVIWTTTPWTIPANQAVCLNAEIDYVLLRGQRQDEEGNVRTLDLVVAKELQASVCQRIGLGDVRVLGHAKGAVLEHLSLHHPYNGQTVPVILGEHVTTEAGTGAVHTAPGHGQEDFEVGQHYGLAVVNPIDGRGIFVEGTAVVAGMFVWKANAVLVEHMRANGSLLADEPFLHSYPHCWRHKTPTAFRTTPQWFISMDQGALRKNALDAIDTVKWVPGWGKERIQSMIASRPDWCISRQRTWGVPLGLFIDRKTQQPHPDTANLLGRLAEFVEKEGVDVWYEPNIAERLGVDETIYEAVPDILDVWFDSGVSHHCVLDQYESLSRPADLYLEGSDQHRGWFQSSLLSSVAMHGEAPYHQVLTHGFVVDSKGRKMSKSLGNVIAPQSVVNTLGADVLRLWVSAADYRQEMHVSDEILKRVSDAYRRIRNTARFLLGNLCDFDHQAHALSIDEMLPLDRYALSLAQGLQQEITSAYEDYRFPVVYQKLHQFCSVDMGAFYLDIIKDRLYTLPADHPARRSAQTAMWHILEGMVRWLSPICPFTAEEMWSCMDGERGDFVALETWYGPLSADANAMDEEGRRLWDTVRTVRDVLGPKLEQLRREGAIGSSLAAEIVIQASGDLAADLSKIGDELRFVFLTATVTLGEVAKPDVEAQIHGDSFKASVQASPNPKCERCWHHASSVGKNEHHPSLCDRCVGNIEGAPEVRQWG